MARTKRRSTGFEILASLSTASGVLDWDSWLMNTADSTLKKYTLGVKQIPLSCDVQSRSSVLCVSATSFWSSALVLCRSKSQKVKNRRSANRVDTGELKEHCMSEDFQPVVLGEGGRQKDIVNDQNKREEGRTSILGQIKEQ